MTLLQDFSADAGSAHPVRRPPEGSLVPEPHSLTTLFADLPLSPEIRREVQEMAQTSPARTVGKGALRNTVVHFRSVKNGCTHIIESHTVEQTLALELEKDPDVLRYFVQVRCIGIERRGGTHVASATVDFMVFRRTGITLVECKTRSAVERLRAKKPEEWIFDDAGNVAHVPLTSWAEARGLKHEVWVSPDIVGPYLSNLQLMYAASRCVPTDALERYFRAVRDVLRTHQASISALTETIRGFTVDTAAALIWHGRLFGPVRHVLISDIDSFRPFLHPEQAEAATNLLDDRVSAALTQSSEKVVSATATDVNRGRKRLERVNRILSGLEGETPRMRPFVRAVQEARSRGENDLACCLTHYASSGNRTPRLSNLHKNILQRHIITHWESGVSETLVDLHLAVADACDEAGVRRISQKTVAKATKRASFDRRNLSVGGMRQFQANRPATDPRRRSLRPQGQHLQIQIDSTLVDNRSMPDASNVLSLERPLIYVAVDRHTDECMADAFIFGAARRQGLGLLFRDYARRHGCLPHAIRMDKGPENTSMWMEEICDRYSINLEITPTGDARGKGQVENLLGRINLQVSQKLAGSTAPDMRGRSVDGSLKSRKTARHEFSTVCQVLRDVLYEHFPTLPDRDGYSPNERKEISRLNTPALGMPMAFDDEFLFLTSMPIKARKLDALKGIRGLGQTFASEELLGSIRQGDVLDVRKDCEMPALLWVKTRQGIYKGWSRSAPLMASKTLEEQIFHSLSDRTEQVAERTHAIDARIALYKKIREIDASESPCRTREVPAANDPQLSESKPIKASNPAIALSFDEVDDL